MLIIGGDDTAPAGDPHRVVITIECDGMSLICADPIVVHRANLPTDVWARDVAVANARAAGWRQRNHQQLGRIWLCPTCAR